MADLLVRGEGRLNRITVIIMQSFHWLAASFAWDNTVIESSSSSFLIAPSGAWGHSVIEAHWTYFTHYMHIFKNLFHTKPVRKRHNNLCMTFSVVMEPQEQNSTQLPKLTCSVKCFKIPLNDGNAEQRTISAQDLSVNQSEAGFGNLFSSATPPVSKNRHSCSSILPLRKKRRKRIFQQQLEHIMDT